MLLALHAVRLELPPQCLSGASLGYILESLLWSGLFFFNVLKHVLLKIVLWPEAHFKFVENFFIVWCGVYYFFSSTQLSLPSCLNCCSVAKLWLQGLQHARLPHPSLSPGACSDSYPLSRWCHPTISSSVTPFSSCPQSFPPSRSFPISQPFASGGQSIGASASVLPRILRIDFL